MELTELLQILVILASIAMIVLAIAAWQICATLIDVACYLERLVLLMELKKPPARPEVREKPPDMQRKPQALAEYEAPLVRRARMRMEERMRRERDGA